MRGEPGADELDACRGVDVGLVRAVGGDADVDIFRQRVDGLVALVHQRRSRGVVCRQALELGVDVGDLLHRRVGLLRRGAEILLDVGAQRLNALGGDVELLRQRLRRAQRNGLRRRRTRAGRQRLQRGGELVQRGFERAAVTGRAIDTLKLLQDVGHLVGVTAAAGLGAQLVQHVAVELPADAGRHRRRAEVAGGDLDLVRRLDDVTRRLRVGDVRGDDRERGLVGTQTAHRTGEG
ncbi:hypothetical protein ABIF42_006751 [Bradyrhizobium diazoefficiens]